MKQLHILALGVALSAACALPMRGMADDETVGEHVKGAAKTTGHAIKEGAEATGHAVKEGAKKTEEFLGLTTSDATRYAANERGHHRMTGQVTAVNHDTGVIDLKTAEAPLQVQFPPKAVKDLNKGDEITIGMGYAMADTATSEKAYDAPKAKAHKAEMLGNEHWVKGTVTQVNHEAGTVSVKTDHARLLKLHFPPTETQNLNTGDHIAVEMGFVKGSHAAKAPANG